ncbi:MAG: hypothetical protein ABR970_20015, partial [Roseiarcus sp.]
AAGADDASARPQTLAIARNATNLETTHFKGFQKDFKGLQKTSKGFQRISKDFQRFQNISKNFRRRPDPGDAAGAGKPAPRTVPRGVSAPVDSTCVSLEWRNR